MSLIKEKREQMRRKFADKPRKKRKGKR